MTVEIVQKGDGLSKPTRLCIREYDVSCYTTGVMPLYMNIVVGLGSLVVYRSGWITLDEIDFSCNGLFDEEIVAEIKKILEVVL